MHFNVLDVTRQRAAQRARGMKTGATVQLSELEIELRNALWRLRATATAEPHLVVDLPAPGHVRVRNLVHRGAQRPVFKISSIKIGRTVQCESPLEADFVLKLDTDANIASFAEQPIRIHYGDGDGRSAHVPDFATLDVHGRLALIEIKFAGTIDTIVRDRTCALRKALHPIGVDYRVLTESDVRTHATVQNASRLLRRARHQASQEELLGALEVLRGRVGLTLDDFGWNVPGSRGAISIAHLVIVGKAAVEPNQLLTGASKVWLQGQPRQEGLSC